MELWTPERIAALRKRLGDTQEDFAARVGVTFVSVSRWENGHSKPSKLAVRGLEQLETERPKTEGLPRWVDTEE